MELGFLLTISCVLTTISMTLLVGVILFFIRYGGQGVKMLIDRFTGGLQDNDKPSQAAARTPTQQQATIASSQSLRQRASQLDFPAQAAPANASFGAQSAVASQTSYPDFPPPQYQQPQQASLTPRYPDFNPQAAQPGQTQGFHPSTPSLSASRPFQAGSQFNANQQATQYGQQAQQGFNTQGYGQQQPLRPNNQQAYGQQQPNQFAQPPQPGFNAQAYGQQPVRPNPQAPNQFGQQQPNQYGQQQPQRPQAPNQYAQPPQAGFNAQSYGQQPNPQQGGLEQNRPPLRSLPRPGNTQYDPPIGRRDSRKGDDRDNIYDEQSGGNLLDDVGDFIDNF